MTTLHDIQTICNKDQFMLSVIIEKALDELQQAREEGDEFTERMITMAIHMMMEEVDAIEE
tara:strand:+ start:532 stop:714 length:183 start_codon:yes stop_codon:yes gene_type:complete